MSNEPLAYRLRAALQMTIESFSVLMGVSPSTVKNWENMRTKPRDDLMLKMAVAYIEFLEKSRNHGDDENFIYVGDLSYQERKALRTVAESYRRRDK